jgi:hypothetical protein
MYDVLWIHVSSSLVVDSPIHHSILFNNLYKKLVQIYSWEYLTYSCYQSNALTSLNVKFNKLAISSSTISPLALITTLNTCT